VNANLDIKSWIVTAAGTCLPSKAPRNETGLPGGVRTLDMDQTLDGSVDGNIGPFVSPSLAG
jgi:hypothetical protein